MDLRKLLALLIVLGLLLPFGCKRKGADVEEEFAEEAVEEVEPEAEEADEDYAEAEEEEEYAGDVAGGGTHAVVWGDTLADITWNYLRGRANYLAVLRVNPQIEDPNLIICGDSIKIPER